MARGSQPARRKRPESQPRSVRKSDDYDDPYTDDDPYTADDSYAEDNIEDYDDPFGGDAPYGYDDYNSAPQRKKKKRRSSGNAGQIVAIAVAIIVAVGAVSGLGFVAWKFIPGLGGNVVDLSYMPEDTAGFVRINVGSVTRSALFRDRIAANPMFLQSTEQLEQQTGMKLSEIDTVTFGFSTGGMGNSPFGGLSAASGAGLIIVRTRTAIPASLLESHPTGSSTAENHNGATIYSLDGRYAWMPNSRTVVIGRREEVVAAIDSNGKQHRFPQFDFASSGYDILIVGEPNATGSAFSAPVGLSLQQEAKGIALGVNLSSGADVAFQVNCNSRAQARASVQKSEEERSQARQNFDRQMARSPFVNQEMSSAVKQLIDEVSISSSGSVLTMKVSIGKDMIDKFVSMIPGM